MKKSVLIISICAVVAGTAIAETGPTEQDYKNLAELRTQLVRMKREMDKFVKEVASTTTDTGTMFGSDFGQDVKVDITESDKAINVKADLPGMDKSKIEITLEGGRFLRIAGSRDIAKEEVKPGVVRQERLQGKFMRLVELPAECMSSGIKADYTNGVLEVIIPKKKTAKEEPVKIKLQ